MRIIVVGERPDGTIVPFEEITEAERQELAERYFRALLQASFPDAKVTIRPRIQESAS